MKVLFALQARSNSNRFPNKIYEKIGEKALLSWAYEACHEANKILKKELQIDSHSKIIGPSNDQTLKEFCKAHQYSSEYPNVDENDLFARYNAAFKSPYTHICRLTADCWRLDPWLMAACVDLMVKDSLDYLSNTIFRTFEEGKDIQACSLKGFQWMFKNQKVQREHPFMEFDLNKNVRDQFEKDGFKYANFLNPRFHFLLKGSSIDTQEDLEVAREVYEKEIRPEMDRAIEKHSGTKLAGHQQ